MGDVVVVDAEVGVVGVAEEVAARSADHSAPYSAEIEEARRQATELQAQVPRTIHRMEVRIQYPGSEVNPSYIVLLFSSTFTH